MTISLERKREQVARVAEMAAKASLALAADYHGLSANAMNELRRKARAEDVSLCVVKNTLAKKALKDTAYQCLSDALSGPMVLIFSNREAPAAARLVRDFRKDNERIEVKLVAIDGELRDAREVERLADLPNREQALALLMAVIREPVAKFVRTLAAPHAKVVATLAALRDAKRQPGQPG